MRPESTRRAWLIAASILAVAASTAPAQSPKKKADTTASFRTLTGEIVDVAAGMATVELGKGEAKKAAAEWKLAFGKPTLLLRAGKNGQYATIEVGDLKKGDVVQSVVEVKADPSDKSHAALWLVVYPTGTSPPER